MNARSEWYDIVIASSNRLQKTSEIEGKKGLHNAICTKEDI